MEATTFGSLQVSVGRISVAPQREDAGLWFKWELGVLREEEAKVAAAAEEAASKDVNGSQDEEKGVESSPPPRVAACWHGQTIVSERVSTSDLGESSSLSGLPLNETFLSELANAGESGLVLTAYSGETGNAEEDIVVASALVPLTELLVGGDNFKLRQDLVLIAPTTSEGGEESKSEQDTEHGFEHLTVQLAVKGCGKMLSYLDGARVLSLSGPVILRNLPEQWLESVGETANTGSENMTLKTLGGRLLGQGVPEIFDELISHAGEEGHAEPSEDAGEGDGQAEKAVSKCLRWEASSVLTPSLFMDRQTVADLIKTQSIEIVCAIPESSIDTSAKAAVEEGTGTALANVAVGSLDLSCLAEQPGSTNCFLQSVVSIMPVEKLASGEESLEGEQTEEQNQIKTPSAVAVSCEIHTSLVPALVPVPKPQKTTLRTVRQIIPARRALQVRTRSGANLIAQAVYEISESVTDEYLHVVAEISAKEEKEEEEGRRPQSRGGMSRGNIHSPSLSQISRSGSPTPFSPKRSPSRASLCGSSMGNPSPGSLSRSRSVTPELVCEKVAPSAQERSEELQSQLLYRLNSSGLYLKIREKLKSAVTKFVSERKALYEDAGVLSQADVLYSLVYEQVMKRVHHSLNLKIEAAKQGKRELKTKEAPPAAQAEKAVAAKVALLLGQAEDAELQGDLERAEAFLQERAALAEREATAAFDRDFAVDPNVWLQYGLHALGRGAGFHAVAAECLRSVLEIDKSSTLGLTAYGALLFEIGNVESNEHIEAFLSAASTAGLADSASTDELSCALAAHGILTLLEERVSDVEFTSSQVLSRCAGIELGDERVAQAALLGRAAQKCLEWNLPRTAAKVMQRRKEALQNVRLGSAQAARMCRYSEKILEGWCSWVKGDINAAEDLFDQATEISPGLAIAWVLRGTLLHGDEFSLSKALECIEAPSEQSQDAEAQAWHHSIPAFRHRSLLFRLGNLHLSKGNFVPAKGVFLRLCKFAPTPAAWVGVGVAAQCNGELDGAMDALSQANALDRCNAETWGFLALCCQQKAAQENKNATQDFSSLAKLAFEQAISLGLNSASLLHQLGTAFADAGRLVIAHQALERVIDIAPEQSEHRVDFCRVLLLQNKYEQAHKELVDLRADPDTDAQELQALESLLAKFSKRKIPALTSTPGQSLPSNSQEADAVPLSSRAPEAPGIP